METPEARVVDRPREIIPSAYGAHNWHPMSFNPMTGLVYLPAQNIGVNLMDNKNWTFGGNTPGEPHGGLGWNLAMYANVEPPKSAPFGRLIAWDPVNQKEAWRQEHVSPWNGGTLTTAGNLVFQGTADGRFIAYNATTGDKLWEAPTGTGVVAGPVTYFVDGRQYVSVAVGWGGVYGIMHRATNRRGPGTVYTFAIGSNVPPPAFVEYQQGALVQGVPYDPAHVKEGTLLYVSNCVFCHGVPGVDRGGNVKNLGYSSGRRDRQHEQVGLPWPGHGRRHAGLHREDLAGGSREDQGFHPGHGGRDPAEELDARHRDRRDRPNRASCHAPRTRGRCPVGRAARHGPRTGHRGEGGRGADPAQPGAGRQLPRYRTDVRRRRE